MITPGQFTVILFLLSLALVIVLWVRPSITASREGKIVAFFALFLFPLLCSAVGFSTRMERTEETSFCLSCHVMEPFGKSLYVDDPHYIAGVHFQNHRVPANKACYTCHTNYVLYGGFRDKMRGMRHIYAQYFTTPPAPADIRLYTPYNNRECLHCHAGARSFEESPTHAAMRDDLVSNQISCLSSGCHDTVHNVASLDKVKFWKPLP